MSDENRFVSESIEELLVALATGVREAQEALNESQPFDAFGRALPTYHIPYLDFDVAAKMVTQRQENGRTIMRLVLSKTSAGSTQSNNEVSSKVSGRFVAVPPGEGLPIPALRLTIEESGDASLRINVLLTNSAGEQLAGKRVELNMDPAATKKLTEVNGSTFDAFRTGTQLGEAILVTDENGEAYTTLRIDGGEKKETILVVTARAGTTTASVSMLATR